MKTLLVFAGVVSSLFLASPAQADSVYTYSGNQFNQWYNGNTCPSLCSISGSFTLATPFVPFTNAVEGLNAGPGYSGGPNPLTSVVPLTYSFTVGPVTLTPADSTILFFELGAEFNTVPQWEVDIVGSGVEIFSFFSGSAAESSDELLLNGQIAALLSTGFGAPTSATCGTTGSPCMGDPGTWTIAGVPEPSTLAMLGVGLLALASRSKRLA